MTPDIRSDTVESPSGPPARNRRSRSNREGTLLLQRPRLLFGFVLIAVAVAALVVTNLMGLSTQASEPVVVPPRLLPLIGTSLVLRDRVVIAKFAGRQYQAGGNDAPAGDRYLVFAVRIRNRGGRALSVRPLDFSVRSAYASYRAIVYPGKNGALFRQSLLRGAQADAYFLVTIPDHSLSGALVYHPATPATEPSLSWGFAAP